MANNKTLTMFIIFLLFSINSNSQDRINSINQLDSEGRKTGEWKKYYSNGKLRYEGQFIKGYEIDTFKYYNTNGQIQSIMIFSDKGTRAHAKVFYAKGALKAEGYYHNRKKDSIWHFYSEQTYKLIAFESYKDDIKHGPWRIYYNNGQMSSETIWKDGKKEGPWLEFFDDGSPKIISSFKNGKAEGSYKAFYSNGMVGKKGVYKNGKMEGQWLVFDENGSKLSISIYENGMLKKETFFKNGKEVKKAK